jgi:Zinc carboxypeptidase
MHEDQHGAAKGGRWSAAPATPEPDAAVPVSIDGLLRGVDLAGEGTVAPQSQGVVLATRHRSIALPVEALHGMRVDGDRLDLFVDTGDVISLMPAARLEALAFNLERQVCKLPELTLSLRGFASRRAHPDETHDRYFAPLLTARRRAEEALDTRDALRAFDAAALRDAFARQLDEFAGERFANSPPDRRALEAELRDCTAGLFASIADLQRAQQALASGDDATRFLRWREWARSVRHVFAMADACWFAVQPVLAGAHPMPRSRWSHWLRRGAAIVALLAPPGVGAQHVSLQISGVPAESLRAHDFDVVAVRQGSVIVVADSADRTRLAAVGWSGSPIFPPGASAARRQGLRASTVTTIYRPFDDPGRGIAAWLDSLRRASALVHVDTAGFSVEGRPVLAVKVGERDDSPERPNALFMATYHAREWAATEVALRLIRYLSQTPAPDARADSLVKRRDIWVLPVVNPDGYEYTFTTDRLWRKNRRPNNDGSFGVDLNRNHTAFWGRDNSGSSPNPSAETFRGMAPESEPETQAIVAFHAAHPPVVSVSYHSFTGLILYPWGHEYGKLPGDLGVFRALAGTDLQPAVRDRLPAPERTYYRPAPGWNLYTANGEYTDWAYSAYGAIAFTPELTSGFENGQFYGFEFPDDEARLQTLFEDNLPFALDVLDAASDPLAARPVATGIASERVGLESVAPTVRFRVPVVEVGSTEVSAQNRIPLTLDTASGSRYTRRLISVPVERPSTLTVRAGGREKRFVVLAASGAERDEEGWSASGFVTDTIRVAGERAWAGGVGRLLSPALHVPAETDSVSVLFWTRYAGNPFSLTPHGVVRVSTDDGESWTPLAVVAGSAPIYYTERADVTGLAGQTIRVEFNASFGTGAPSWWIDEIAVVVHGVTTEVDDGPPRIALRVSENPVRGSTVFFSWPFGAEAGAVLVYDFRGRLVWRQRTDGAPIGGVVTWNIRDSGTQNGVYVAIARAGGRAVRLKLFVARRDT